MPYCHECGKQVAQTAKFCRNCGASQLEELPSGTLSGGPPQADDSRGPSVSSPAGREELFSGAGGARGGDAPENVPPPSSPPMPPPVSFTDPVPPPPPLTCPVCSQPLIAGTRFCGGCGSPVSMSPVPAPTPGPDTAPLSPSPKQTPPAATHPLHHQKTRLCRSCGFMINQGDNFCRKCLARVVDDPVYASGSTPEPGLPVSAPPSPPPAQSPVTTPVSPPPGSRSCRSCGFMINQGDTFCRKCLARVVDDPVYATGSTPEPGLPFSAPPSPPPAQSPVTTPVSSPPGTRSCRSCGNTIHAGDLFCSRCLAKVSQKVPPFSIPGALPDEVPPAPGSLPVCGSCGSPVKGVEKFCGICGTPVVTSMPPPQGVTPGETMTCTGCGAPFSATTKFCGECGTSTGAVSAPGAIPPPQTVPSLPLPASGVPLTVSGEEVTGVIGNARTMKMFGASWDTYTLVVTNRRLIVARVTQALLNAAILEAQSQAKAEGKGFFSIMKDQMAAQFRFALRYEKMSPDQALAETPGNFAVDNTHITSITMKLKDAGSGDAEYTEFRMIIESAMGTFEYLIAEDDRFINLLKAVYNERVHMPFGYFKAGGVRVKFF